MKNPIAISCPSNAKAIGTDTSDWRDSVHNLLAHWCSNRRCFSSGEVAAALREHLPALRFSVLSIGEHLRDLFYTGALNYPGAMTDPNSFGDVSATQVPRITEGLFPDRTHAGVEVFVYGPDEDACLEHGFEVYIPVPGQTQADAPVPSMGQTAQAQADPTGKTKTAVAILGAKVASLDIRAKVHTDARLCVPRSAFELAIHLGATPLRGGDPVWVKTEGDKVFVSTTDPSDTSYNAYSLGASMGRVLFPSPNPSAPFSPGDTYRVTAEAGRLTVDISAPL